MDQNGFALHSSLYPRQEPPTHVSYAAWHIVLSFFTSLIGCITTLELLQRRTSIQGIYNWYLHSPQLVHTNLFPPLTTC